jgi:hypothetical protein
MDDRLLRLVITLPESIVTIESLFSHETFQDRIKWEMAFCKAIVYIKKELAAKNSSSDIIKSLPQQTFFVTEETVRKGTENRQERLSVTAPSGIIHQDQLSRKVHLP